MLWRRLHLGRNPLARWSDRCEAALAVGAVLAALLAIPFAAAAGSDTYARKMLKAAEQTVDRRETTAMLLADAPPVRIRLDGVPIEETAYVHARWTVPGGPIREGVVAVESGAMTGNEVRIWLDAAGKVVDPPVTPTDATSTGIGVGVGTWLAFVTLLAGLYLGCRVLLGRSRETALTREWERVAKDWTAA
ncbi:hypothetical protein CFP75_31160 [Amycolatopsis alba DSM 44262]|uniref:Transmembrane protein n=2 Tax=Amycolatopsis alba TaxID=76020 RepID=A0A229RFH7_AMYAL|nr:hypothetical protein CFP75_31160 [Amycolatopsis alba DSM 44262]